MKSLPKFAVDNHRLTLMVVLGLVVYGFFAVWNMPKAENPSVQPPGVSVIVRYPGASPSDIEELITKPIEDIIGGVSDLRIVTSTCGNGYAIVGAQFEMNADPDEKYSEISEKVNAKRSELPADLQSIEIYRWSVDDVRIIQLALVSETASYVELQRELEKLEDEIRVIKGIAETEIIACPQREIRVSADLNKMSRMNIPLDRVIAVIQANNMNIPAGRIDIGRRSFNIATSGSYAGIDDLANTPIPLGDAQIVYLKDIAEVEYRFEDLAHTARFNSAKAIFLTATQQPGTNIFDIKRELDGVVEKFRAKLPDDMSLEVAFDQGNSVRDFILGFLMNLVQGVILVGLITWLGIGNRPSAVAMISIPSAIIISMGFVNLAGFGIQQIQIAGLVVALGLIVDNAIVVTQNINRFIADGADPKTSAIDATVEVGPSIASGTITTCLAFLPIIMMSDMAGDFIKSMPGTVIFTLLVSLFLAMTLVPFLASRWFAPESAKKAGHVQKLLDRFIRKRYRKAIRFSLRRPKLIIGVSVAMLIAVLPLAYIMGTSLFPKAGKAQMFINIELPEGSSRAAADKAVSFAEEIIAGKDYVVHHVANVAGHNPRIYYNAFPKQSRPNIGQLLVEVDPARKREIPLFVKELRRDFEDYPGASIEVKELEQGYPNDAPVAIHIIGKNLGELERISFDTEEIFRKTPGVVNVSNPMGGSRTDIKVRINREKAAMLGLTLAEVDKAVRFSMAGIRATSIRDEEGELRDVVIRLPADGTPTMADFERIYISNPEGTMIPLSQLASVEFEAGPYVINHYDFKRSVTITADVATGYNVNRATEAIVEELERYDWPDGFHYNIGGEMESQNRAFGGLGRSFTIAVLAIFAVLVYQFKSFRQPFIIFSTIPLAIVGSIIALFLSGNNISFTAMIGLTSLAGIVINNAIILVDFANRRRAEGDSTEEALISAGEIRFVPIVLTAATTIGGLLPLTLFGGLMWNPMGWAIIGGLITSTALTLLVVPVLYKLLSRDITEVA